jgi:hypothetical protein
VILPIIEVLHKLFYVQGAYRMIAFMRIVGV